MQSTEDLNSWKQHIGEILAQVEGLKTWFEREQRTLTAAMCAQLSQIEAEIQELQVDATPNGSTQHASRMAAHIEALKARGDLAYDLLTRASPQGSPKQVTSAVSE
ncbi:MAG: hypothetical protein ACLQUY_00400 [Ktedonobacterales bacterium]